MSFKKLGMAVGTVFLAFATSAAADNLAFRTVGFDEYKGTRNNKHVLNTEGIKQFAARARDTQDSTTLKCVIAQLSKSADPAVLRENHDLITGFVDAARKAGTEGRKGLNIASVNDAVGVAIGTKICKRGPDLALVNK